MLETNQQPKQSERPAGTGISFKRIHIFKQQNKQQSKQQQSGLPWEQLWVCWAYGPEL